MRASFETVKKLEAAARRRSLKKFAPEISQNSSEKTGAGAPFLITLQTGSLQLYQKQAPAQLFSSRFQQHIFSRTPASKKRAIESFYSFFT